MKQPKDREVKVVLEDVPEEEEWVSALRISAVESKVVDDLLTDPIVVETVTDEDDDEVYATRSTLDQALLQWAEEGDFMMSVGASFTKKQDTNEILSDTEDESVSSGDESDDDLSDLEEEIDYYLLAAVSGFSSGVTPEHLSKV